MTTLPTNLLVILLHGFGSNGADLAPLGVAWSDALPGAVFVSPNAPERSGFGSGYQWFSVEGVTEENRPARIREARASFDAELNAIVQGKGFSGKLDHVVLVGFSQGTIMALDAIATGRWPVAAVVGFSGRLASPEPLHPSLSTRVLLIHGSADPVIPSSETTKAAAALEKLGVTVEAIIQRDLTHTISADGVKRAAAFLAGVNKD
jgi:phospholipase/carboxylesterase